MGWNYFSLFPHKFFPQITIPLFTGHVVTYPWWDESQTIIEKYVMFQMFHVDEILSPERSRQLFQSRAQWWKVVIFVCMCFYEIMMWKCNHDLRRHRGHYYVTVMSISMLAYPYERAHLMTTVLLPRLGGAFDLRLAVSVPLPIVMGIFVLLWFQSRLT